MNLIYKLQNDVNFTTSEKYIAKYILAHNIAILKMNTKELGIATYTSPATIVRFCQKIGFNGFDDFKIQFAQDYTDNINKTNSVDYNYPFHNESTTQEVINAITTIEGKTIEEMLHILDVDNVDKVVRLMKKAKQIEFYGYGTSLIAAYEFEFQMNRINKNVRVTRNTDSLLNTALRSNETHLAFIISYSGETEVLLQIAQILKENKTPIILLSSNTESKLKRFSNFHFPIVTHESLYSKIGPFSSSIALKLVLDVLYSCFYRLDFDNNTKFLLDNAQKIETRKNKQIDS